jgi:hypothetical protein
MAVKKLFGDYVPIGQAKPTGSTMLSIQASEQGHSVLHGPRIKIADSAHAPNSLGAIVLRAKLAAKIADVEVNASIKRRELSVENILDKCFTGQNLSWGLKKRPQ